MMIFDFLVLKNENFGFENPYEPLLDDFGEFLKNPKKWTPIERGGCKIKKRAENFWIFPKLPKFTQKLVLGVFESEIFDFEHQKPKIVIIVPKITQIRHSAIFRKNRFFHVFKAFQPLRAQKIDFYKIFELSPKTVYKGVFR